MWATNAKIVGIVLGTLALYTLIANEIPQVQSEVPQTLTLGANVTPEQLVAAGRKGSTGSAAAPPAHGQARAPPHHLPTRRARGRTAAAAGKRRPERTPRQSGTDPKAIIQAAGCLACHKLDGQGQVIAPDLTHVGSRRDAESIRKKILDPASSVTKGYEKLAGIMPKSFGTMMNAAQLEALVQYLGAHK